MKILVIGSGAREHAIAWKIAQSPKVKELFIAPGNAGTAGLGQNVAIKAEDTGALVKFARENRIDVSVVGPEQPLAAGIVDLFQENGLAIFGPTQKAAAIESSKVFARDLMQRHGIPCARGASFASYEAALEYARKQRPPVVVKADGLAAGKGVIIAGYITEAEKALEEMMLKKAFGPSGEKVVIEEYLVGREMSFFVFTDGRTVIPTVPACDYKRIFDGDRGPNTGGMGSYSPPPFYSEVLGHIIMKTIMEPAVRALADEGRPYRGTLYGGLMIAGNSPVVMEFNARLGDPETQVVLPRLKTDLVEVMMAVVEGRLENVNLEWQGDACVGVVMASSGYPGTYRTGFPINGLNEVDKDIIIFHAGTRTDSQGRVLTSGGRVLTVVATGQNLNEAREKVYRNLPRIRFEGAYYRTDIARFDS